MFHSTENAQLLLIVRTDVLAVHVVTILVTWGDVSHFILWFDAVLDLPVGRRSADHHGCCTKVAFDLTNEHTC